MKEPLINILMPVFNGEDYIDQAIKAVLEQDYKNFTLFILDDGSTDSTREIAESYLYDNRIKIHSEYPNRGLVYTRNRGLGLIDADYFAFTDSDDFVEKNWLSEQIKFLLLNPNISILGCWVRYVDNKGMSINDRVWHTAENPLENACHLLKGPPIPAVATMFRVKCAADMRFSEEYHAAEDYACWASLCLNQGYEISNVQAIMVNYRLHEKQISGTKNVKQVESHLNVFKYIFSKMSIMFDDSDIVKHAFFVGFVDDYYLFKKNGIKNDSKFLFWALRWSLIISKASADNIFNAAHLRAFLLKNYRKTCKRSIGNIGVLRAVFIFLFGYFCISTTRFYRNRKK